MMFKERKVLTDLRYNFQQKGTFASAGGLALIRNQEEERRNILELKRYFGDVIHLKKKHGNGKDKVIDKVQYNISAQYPI
jgi:hypothetical protein